MRLIHQIVEIVPGRRPQQPLPDGQPFGPGSALVRIENTTAQENAYVISVVCEDENWQKGWYTLEAVPPIGGEDASAAKPAQYSDSNRRVRLFVPRGSFRDVAIRFNLLQRPDSRAGAYHFLVQIDTEVNTGGKAKPRTLSLPGTAMVRPYYTWTAEIAPEICKASMIRRSGEFDLTIRNESNDWLYCEIKPPRPTREATVTTASTVVAVPPPEVGETSVRRIIPIHAATTVRALRGNPVVMPVNLSIARIDAPSLGRPEQDPYLASYGMPGPTTTGNGGANGAVLALETTEVKQPTGEAALVYHPIIPATLTGFVNAITANARGLVLTIAGLLLLAPILMIALEQIRHRKVGGRPENLSLFVSEKDRKLLIRGSYLLGSVILIEHGGAEEAVKPQMMQAMPADNQKAAIIIPEKIGGKDIKDGARVRFRVQRVGMVGFLKPMLPVSEYSMYVTVGEKKAEAPKFSVTNPLAGNAVPGKAMTIRGVFPPNPAAGLKVIVGGQEIAGAKWAKQSVTFTVPKLDANQYSVSIEDPSGNAVPAGTVNVIPAESEEMLPPPGEPLPADAAAAAAAGGAGAAGAEGGASPGTPPTAVIEAPTGNLALQMLLAGQSDAALPEAESYGDEDPTAVAIQAYILAEQDSPNTRAKVTLARKKTTGKSGEGRSLALAAQLMYMAAQARKGEPQVAAEAKKAYDEARKASPNFILAYTAFADFSKEGDPAAAKAALDTASKMLEKIRKEPYAANLYKEVAKRYRDMGQDEAAHALEQSATGLN